MADTPQPQATLPTAADVDAAAGRLAGVALRTPLIASPVLDAAVGARVFLKAETLQRTGSFKFRGAYNKLSSIPQDRRAGGVVAYSSGNHAQGVAAAAQLLGMPAVIVMPSDAPRPKRERTAALGAEVVLYDRDREDRAAIARDIADKRGAVLVPPFDDPMVIAGQGTTGREIVEDLAALGLKPDVVVVGASGGGLIAGIALAIKATRAGRKILFGRAGRFRRHRALVQKRQARGQCAHERHHLRRADDQHAGRHHFRDQPQTGGRRGFPPATRRSGALSPSRSASSSSLLNLVAQSVSRRCSPASST